MAQDPEQDEDRDETGQDDIDRSHDLDLVTLYASESIETEPEADVIRGLLDANGIPSVLVQSPFPPVGMQVQVPRALVDEARRVIEEAQAAGPQAAAEAEAASEENQ